MPSEKFSFNRLQLIVRKTFLSAFVVITFLAYVLHERLFAGAQTNDGAAQPPADELEMAPALNQRAPTSPPTVSGDASVSHTDVAADDPSDGFSASADATVVDTPTPEPTSIPSNGLYKDGTYTGSEADAYYGLVQVQAVIQNGKITAVNFLEYPNHRRTSVSINQQAMPWLQQEAIQAQNAQVDIISGATLTSEAFRESLQVALDSARN